MSPDPSTARGSNKKRSEPAPPVPDGFLEHVRTAVKEPFEVEEMIGQGGMAVVFRAYDPPHNRHVAVKVLQPELTRAIAGDRFLREVEITGRLQHPHIVSLFDSGSADGLLYYVMPFVEGESLRNLVEREGSLPIGRAVQIVDQVLGALAYAHARGAVHRDIKPENILLSSDLAMVADFGIARAVEEVSDEEALTDQGIAIGTPEYMSPEQCMAGRVDPRGDIYSVGCVLYELVAGEPPFMGRTSRAVIAKQIGVKPPPIRVVRPNTPRRLAKVIHRALEKVPADRYQSAEAMRKALAAAVAKPSGIPVLPAAIATAAAGIAVGILLNDRAPELDPNKIAVFPLEERGLAAEERGAGTDIMILISTALEGADPLRPLDVRERLTEQQREDPASITPEYRKTVAEEIGAARYTTGFVQGHGDSITVGIRLHDARGDSLIDQRSAVAGRLSPKHHVGIDAIKEILPALGDPGRDIDLTVLRERTAAAMALFILGERAYRESRFEGALDYYQRAIAEDSAMAIAGIKGAMAANWIDHGLSADLAQYSVARDSLLPLRYAAFARGLSAFTAGHADTAETQLQTAMAAVPEWPEAAMQLGEVYYHLVPLHASLDSLAEAMFTASVAFDSTFTPAMFHLAEIAIRNGELRKARDLIGQFAATEPRTDLVEHLNLMMACAESAPGEFDWSVHGTTNVNVAFRSAKALAVAGFRLDCAERGFGAVLASGEDSLQWAGIFGTQAVLIAGDWAARVVGFTDSVVTAGQRPVAETSYLLGVGAGLPVSEQALNVVEKNRARWGNDYAGLVSLPYLDWLQWLFGVWHAGRGDEDIVQSLAHSLAQASAGSETSSTTLYAEAIEAHSLILASDTASAIELLRRLTPRITSDSLEWSFGLPLAVERLKLAELLVATGAEEDALAVASIFDHPGPMVYVAFLPASLELRIQAAEALGRRREADGYRTRLAALNGSLESMR